MAGRKKQLMSWLGTGTNAKDVGTSISYVYDAVDENDELIDLTLSLQADAAVQFWLDQKQSKQGERTIFIAMHGEIVTSQTSPRHTRLGHSSLCLISSLLSLSSSLSLCCLALEVFSSQPQFLPCSGDVKQDPGTQHGPSAHQSAFI